VFTHCAVCFCNSAGCLIRDAGGSTACCAAPRSDADVVPRRAVCACRAYCAFLWPLPDHGNPWGPAYSVGLESGRFTNYKARRQRRSPWSLEPTATSISNAGARAHLSNATGDKLRRAWMAVNTCSKLGWMPSVESMAWVRLPDVLGQWGFPTRSHSRSCGARPAPLSRASFANALPRSAALPLNSHGHTHVARLCPERWTRHL
jgi:hypothetical protein